MGKRYVWNVRRAKSPQNFWTIKLHVRKFSSAWLTSRYWKAIVRTGTEQKSIWKILKERNRVNFLYTKKFNGYLVMCSFVTSLLIFFFSSTYLWFLFYLILEKNCGSKNWGGPVYRKFNRTIDRPQDGAALSQIPIYKNIHMSNLLIRVCICFFSPFPLLSHVYAVQLSIVHHLSCFVLPSPAFRFIKWCYVWYMCMRYSCTFLFFSFHLRTSTYPPVNSR